MELSALKNKIWEIFSVQNNDLFSAVMEAAKNEQMLSSYCELVGGDLNTDELQKIFQYHYADRKEKMQDYTPASLPNCVPQRLKQTEKLYMISALEAER